MSRILLVDDSPHAQRMGERILSEEGFEVVTVSNADSALIRLDDVDPDVVLADTVMPGRSGYEICQFVKLSPRHRHVRVVLTAGILEPLDDEQVRRVQADGTLKKPFEASMLLATIKPLAERAAQERAQISAEAPAPKAAGAGPAVAPFVTVVDAEQVRAAVTVALDAAMERMVDEITRRVLTALQGRKTAAATAVAAQATMQPATSAPETPASAARPAPPPQPTVKLPDPRKPDSTVAPPRLETVRRVSPLRSRPGSILGLDLNYVEPEVSSSAPRAPSPDPLFSNARPAVADPDPGSRATPPSTPLRSDSGSRAPADPRSAPPYPRPPADPDPGARPPSPDKK